MQVTFFFRIRTTLLVAKQQLFMICVPWILQKKIQSRHNLQDKFVRREKRSNTTKHKNTQKYGHNKESQGNGKDESGMGFWNIK